MFKCCVLLKKFLAEIFFHLLTDPLKRFSVNLRYAKILNILTRSSQKFSASIRHYEKFEMVTWLENCQVECFNSSLAYIYAEILFCWWLHISSPLVLTYFLTKFLIHCRSWTSARLNFSIGDQSRRSCCRCRPPARSARPRSCPSMELPGPTTTASSSPSWRPSMTWTTSRPWPTRWTPNYNYQPPSLIVKGFWLLVKALELE